MRQIPFCHLDWFVQIAVFLQKLSLSGLGQKSLGNLPRLTLFSKDFAANSFLLLDEREEAHEAGTLDGRFDGALLFGSQSRALTRDDATVRIDELLQKVDVFVVDMLDIILCEDVGHIRKVYRLD